MSFLSSSLSTLTQNTLRVAAFPGFAPFAWQDGGEARGRDIDFLRGFAAEHGAKVVVDFHAFDRLWELPGQGRADVAASGISLRGMQANGVTWTRPYSEVRRTLLVRREDAGWIRGLDDVGVLAVVPNSFAQEHAEGRLRDGARMVFAPTLEDGVRDLQRGRIDALGTGSVSAEYLAGRHEGLALVDVHADRAPERISFVTRPELAGALDAFIVANAGGY